MRRTALALTLLLVTLAAIVSWDGPVSAREPQWSSGFLFCDIVAEGTLESVEIRIVRYGDTWPREVRGNGDMNIRVAEVTLRIDSMLKGYWGNPTIQFIVDIDRSGYRENYEVGQRSVVGLMWGQDMLGGMYWLFSERARLVWQNNKWAQQGGDMVELDDLTPLSSFLAELTPERILSQEQMVVTGILQSESFERHTDAAGREYVLRQMHLGEVRLLPGATGTVPADITVSCVAGEYYWPAWRLVSSFPQVLVLGQEYCVAVRATTDGYVVPYGRDGVYQVKDGELFTVSGSGVAVSVASVTAERSGGR